MKTSKSDQAFDPIDFWQVFRELPDSYLLIRADEPRYTIVELNRTREMLTNVARKEALGKPLFDIYPDVSGNGMVREQLARVIKTGRPIKLKAFRYDLRNAQGKLEGRYWQSSYLPVKNTSGTIAYVLAVTQDITNQFAAERRMRRAEERLEAALEIGKVGSWAWDVDKDIVIGDANLAKMFGVSKSAAHHGLSLQVFLEAIHPDDRQQVEQSIRRSVQAGSEFDEEYRTFVKGRTRWMLARGRVREDTEGKVFTGVIVDITERRDLLAQIELARQQDRLNQQAAKLLQQRNDELEAISRTKDEFVALASHQLRTPATAVKQYIGMVLQGYVGEVSDIQREMLSKAFESNERQIEIINQILNAARVDTGRLMMSHISFDLRAFIDNIAADMRHNMEQQQHDFRVELPDGPVRITGDQGYLRMAIENILDNARLYTPTGGTIRVQLGLDGQSGVISISDNGVGIRKADISKLFVKFSRIHNPLSVQAGGSGIGLYLAGEIIKLHGGNITVNSVIGKGTTFAISIPLEQNETKSGTKDKSAKAHKTAGNHQNMRTGLQTRQ